MERYLIKAILKICAECLLFTLVTGVVIGILGYLRKWDSPLAYSNAFFLAGCLFIIAGGLSRQAAGEDWNRYQLSSGEGFQGMSTSERANFIVNISSPVRHIVIGLLTGILLILISAVAGYLL